MLPPNEERIDVVNSPLGTMLLEEITPVIMVIATPLVEEACQKNKLNLVEILQPYCSFDNIDVPVRTASDQPYRLQRFKLRLVYASNVIQPNPETAAERVKEAVRSASDKLPDFQGEDEHYGSDPTVDNCESRLSWFQDFNREIVRTLSFSDHEAFDHPVACLLAVSSKDEQPVNKFVDIFDKDQLPSLLKEGAMDPKILKYYLLVHDNQEARSDKAVEILAEMRGTFGSSSCQLLCMNSSLGEGDECQSKPWIDKEADASNDHEIGCFLDVNDLNEIRDLLQELSTKHIIPYMEQKIRILNAQVSTTRKGFKNQIKNLWWRKAKEEAADDPNGPKYSFSSLESQIRVLGDHAFMLRDYELALSSYRLLSTDYKIDKAWKRYAGVQEMAGLCLFMLDQSRKDAEYYMETALNTYLKLGSLGHRNATRCGIWLAEMLKTREQHKEAANVLLHISNQEPSLHAAVILEQASHCYLHSDPPMLRKYGLFCVLAGSQYNICDQRKLAIQAYRSALSVYRECAWTHIQDHVHYNLGRWYAIVGIYDAAVQHMLQVLACTHQSLPTQKLFFGDFLHIVQELQKLGKKFDVSRLEVPYINLSSLKISYEDHRTFASASAACIKETMWQSLEEEMTPSVSSVRTNWLESIPKSVYGKKRVMSPLCVAGEMIRVDIEFRNPLQIPIDVKGVYLLCEFSSRSYTKEAETLKPANHEDKVALDISLPDDAEFRNTINGGEHASAPFSTPEVDFVLKGNDAITVELNVTPKIPGILKIVGVRWTLSGSVVGHRVFDSELAEKRGDKARQNLISWDHKLKFIVLKSLPKLVGCIHNIPQEAYKGELHRLILELSNVSKSPVKNLKVAISNPRLIIPGREKDLDLDFPCCLQTLTIPDENNATEIVMNSSKNSMYIFLKGATVEGLKSFRWPLWFHASMVGSISLDLSVYYEMENPSDEMGFRTLRMHYSLEVLPSLDVSFQIIRSPSRLDEFLVRMDVVNNSRTNSFWLHQVSVVGDHFYLSSLSSHILEDEKEHGSPNSSHIDKIDIGQHKSICPGQMLPDGQKASQLFKIVESQTFISSSALDKEHGRFHPCSSSAHQIYVSNSPLSDFHLYERSSEENKSCPEVGSKEGTVDFILISQQVQNNYDIKQDGLSDSLPLCSHHICHCRIDNMCPISWLMEGPHTVIHDFAKSFCEMRFQVTVQNSSDAVAFIRLVMFNQAENEVQLSDVGQLSGASEEGGWHEISLGNSGKVLSDLLAQSSPSRKQSSKSISSYVWTGSSSTKVKLEPLSSAVIPLNLCIFAPGVYDLSNYELQWDIKPCNDGNGGLGRDSSKRTAGTSLGHPFYLTALQSA
ncbi:uncharacterized protein LOC116263167 isoform X2 [Nymphaea colorata]|uniref:uncharacterized protein LOC116263167 isoform X2 n=1 Tax=Nymphaea colorata TaxID=210225 RepID=UPI00129DD5DE|nr:uncharacterized protein LOC116263167 isoform X2 [Nymphaea colorata]